mmetsp:Transcript_9515/g.28744  ORF Transcript_9515/g.28744 Transcript_9515/m.28744 type:complete len:483 (+) Transcript_9515:78-1526(+)
MKRALDKGKHKVSKGITQATTLGHANVLPFKFRFELTNVRVARLKARDGPFVLVWERRDKQVATEEVDLAGDALEFTDGLRFDCTLFRAQNESEFQEKKAKLAVRTGGKNGKTVAKVHIDLGQYARVPSGTETLRFKLSDGSSMTLTCTSTLSKSGRSKKGSAGGSSAAFSVFTTGSGGLSQGGDFDDLADLDDLNDLGLEDDGLDLEPAPKPAPTTKSPVNKPISPVSSDAATTTPINTGTTTKRFAPSWMKPKANANPPNEKSVLSLQSDSEPTDKKPILGMIGSKLAMRGRYAGRNGADPASTIQTVEFDRKVALLEQENIRLTKNSEKTAAEVERLQSELDKLEKEVVRKKKARARQQEVGQELNSMLATATEKMRRLRDDIEDLSSRNADLAEELAVLNAENEQLYGEGESLQNSMEELEEEQRDLNVQLDECQQKLKRAANEEAMVNELKSLKMQIAAANMEKDEAVQKLRAAKGN